MHPMHTVWEILEFGANTVIFILAGDIISAELYNVLVDSEINGNPLEWVAYGVLIFIICIVSNPRRFLPLSRFPPSVR